MSGLMRWSLIWSLLLLCLFFVLGGCSPEFFTPPAGNKCKTSADCPGQMICDKGNCINNFQKKENPDEDTDEPKADGDEPTADGDEPSEPSDGGDAGDVTPDDGGDPDEPKPEPDCKDGDSRDCPYTGPTGTKDVGPCKGGKQTCVKGQWSKCEGEVLPKDEENCNGIDDDCDGKTDEELTRKCYTGKPGTAGKGACREGSQICKDGIWGACKDEVQPELEVCDGKDNDCDGDTDEGCTCKDGATQACGSDSGECKKGKQTCSGGKWGACTGETKPKSETCDGKDNDCNGSIDENLTKDCYGGPSGTDGKGECSKGKQTCSSGTWGACTGEVKPTSESCDNKDNDCDGQVDENVTQECYSGPAGTGGVGECKKGKQTCSKGVWGACTGEVKPASKEACDKKDNDCDGQVDEGCTCADGDTQACGSDTGICTKGKQTCASGKWGTCVGETKPGTEICDGKDNDCDGSTDEGGVCKPDLTISSVTLSAGESPYASGKVGFRSLVKVTLAIANKGKGTFSSADLVIYYGQSTATSGLTTIYTASVASIKPGATASTTYSVYLPASVLEGKRYLHFALDPSNKIAEDSETNNRSYKDITITAKPDLQLYELRLASTSGTPGSSNTVYYRIINIGAAALNSTFSTGLYFSTDGTITTADTLLKAVEHKSLNLNSRAITSTYNASVTIPATAKAGLAAFVGGFVDYKAQVAEASESNNTRSTTYNVLSSSPDLVFSSFRITGYSSTTTIGYKTQVNLSYEVKNTGNADARDSVLYIYYSHSSASTTYRMTSIQIPALKKGTSTGAKTVTVTLPPYVYYGSRYIVGVLDATNLVAESSESNNKYVARFTVNQLPDYYVSSYRITNPKTFNLGDTVYLEFDVRNIGYASGDRSTQIEIFFSSDGTYGSGDVRVYATTLGPLYSQAYRRYRATIRIPGSPVPLFKTRTSYFLIMVDRANYIRERTETNNIRVVGFRHYTL